MHACTPSKEEELHGGQDGEIDSLPALGQAFFVAVMKHCEFSERQKDTF